MEEERDRPEGEEDAGELPEEPKKDEEAEPEGKGKKGFGRKRVFKKADDSGSLSHHLGSVLPLLLDEFAS